MEWSAVSWDAAGGRASISVCYEGFEAIVWVEPVMREEFQTLSEAKAWCKSQLARGTSEDSSH